MMWKPIEMAEHSRHDRRRMPRLLIALGLVLVLAAGGWQAYAALWLHHYHQAGGVLVQQEQTKLSAAGAATKPPTKATCAATTASGGPQGLLDFKELGVVAPVEEGESDAVLAVAVGHDASSVWPGSPGTAVFASHDVTYFVNIDKLKPGQAVTYLTPCDIYTYTVTSQKVVDAGSPIYNSATPTLALVTCWPTNALFYTSHRLVVYLKLTNVQRPNKANVITGVSNGVLTSDARQPAVPVPQALAVQGLTLSSNYAPMGTLTILGKGNPAYIQSPAPLLAQDAALVAYFAGLRSLAEGHTDWWKHFAPGVSVPSQLLYRAVSSYSAPLNVFVEAHANSVTGVALQSTVIVDGESYTLKVGTRISSKNVLTISSWTVS
jgi:LPXTG-site transpeptidase (sortase) family protein